jgi:hypothetical protein
MRRIFAGAITIGVVSLMAWVGLRGPVTSSGLVLGKAGGFRVESNSSFDKATSLDPSGFQDASDRIEGLLASARDGDVDGYLSALGGSLRSRLEREAGEHGRAAFAARLRKAGRARMSHAIFAPEPALENRDAVRITVESTFADRLERQTYHLERVGNVWLAVAVEAARERIPRNLPGSLASFEEPEGIPVPLKKTSGATGTKGN